jgi:type IV pilus assembly protein PilX
MHGRPRLRHREHGSALIISLVFLVAMTLIAVTAMRDTSLQERMAGNLRDRSLAFQAAEGSLRDGETWLLSPAGRLAAGALLDEIAAPDAWDGVAPAPSQPAAAGFVAGGLHDADPVYHVSPPRVARARGGSLDIAGSGLPPVTVFHEVTARGVGGTDTTTVILQSTVVLE